MNLRNISSLVRDLRPCRQPRGNRIIEFLPLQNRRHLFRRFLIHRFVFRDRCHQNLKSSCGRGVVQSFVERLLVFHSPQDTHSLGSQSLYRRSDILTPSFSTSRFVARLLLTVVISSASCSKVLVCPSALYNSASESSPTSNLNTEPSTML